MNHRIIILLLLFAKGLMLNAQNVDSIFLSNINKKELSEEFIEFISDYDKIINKNIRENEQIILTKIEELDDPVLQCKLNAALAQAFWYTNNKEKLKHYLAIVDSLTVTYDIPFGKLKKVQLEALSNINTKDYNRLHFLLDSVENSLKSNIYNDSVRGYLDNAKNEKNLRQLFSIGLIFTLLTLLIFTFIRNIDKRKNIIILRKNNEDLEIAKARAEDASRLKTEFISNISHEIRTPMNAIQGFIELIDNDTSQEELSKFLNIISLSSENLMKTVDDLMLISRIKANQVKIKNRSFSLTFLLDSVCSIARQKISEQNKSIEVKSDFKNNLEITTDYTVLMTILTHIIDNSVKFTSSGKITVSSSSSNGFATIDIIDTGIGFDMSEVHLVTTEFYKIHNNNKLFRGSGVGLSIASRLAEEIDVGLEIESKLNEGTRVSLSIRNL